MSYKFTKEELEELLIDYNKITIKDQKLEVPSKVCIWDETLRDGEQSPTVYLTLDEKIHLAKLMDEIGVKLIAVGFPAVSKSEKKIVKTIVNENFYHFQLFFWFLFHSLSKDWRNRHKNYNFF